MKRIKLSISDDNLKCNRQLPECGVVWRGYEFIIDTKCKEADYWVVYNKIFEPEDCHVAPENTMFISGEPDSVYHYAQGFLNQFGKVLSCQKNLKHRNCVMSQPGWPWHLGRITNRVEGSTKESGAVTDFSIDYDQLKVSKPEKTKLISVISSARAFTKGHRKRLEFVRKLKEHYGDQMDVFGWGINGFKDKWDVISPYKYHIAIENTSIPYYWTEKLADTYLGNAFPIYYGATNVGEFFDEKSFITIDIHDPEDAIRKIDKAIAEDLATKRAADVEVAKQLVLDKYNLFNLIVDQIQNMDPDAPKKDYHIKHDRAFFDLKKAFLLLDRIKNIILKKIHG